MSRKLAKILILRALKLVPNSIIRAQLFCRIAHHGQRRKGTKKPFATHPIAVGKIVSEYTNDPHTIAGGNAHDVDEDTDFTIDDIKYLLGKRVAHLVKLVSEVRYGPDGKKLGWRDRKQGSLDVLEQYGDSAALTIKAADHVHNLEDTVESLNREQVASKFNASPEERLWYSKEMLRIARAKNVPQGLLQRLERAIAAFEQKFITT